MLEKIEAWLKRRRDPARMREAEENRLRAQQELRQAEERKSENQRGVEGVQRGMPFDRP
jgi:hypothetical protein